MLSQVQAAEMGFLRRVHGVTLRVKGIIANFVKRWMSSLFSSERKDPATLVLPCNRNDPGEMGGTNPAGFTYGTLNRNSTKAQVASMHPWTGLVLSGCGTSRTAWECCWTWCILSPRVAASLVALFRGNEDVKMNEKWRNYWMYKYLTANAHDFMTKECEGKLALKWTTVQIKTEMINWSRNEPASRLCVTNLFYGNLKKNANFASSAILSQYISWFFVVKTSSIAERLNSDKTRLVIFERNRCTSLLPH